MVYERRPTNQQIDAELAALVEQLKSYRPERIVLHGSLARGDWNRASDIDLIIVKATDQPFIQRIGDVLDLCRSAMDVEPLVYTPDELRSMLAEGNSFLEKALTEGRVLYDADQT